MRPGSTARRCFPYPFVKSQVDEVKGSSPGAPHPGRGSQPHTLVGVLTNSFPKRRTRRVFDHSRATRDLRGHPQAIPGPPAGHPQVVRGPHESPRNFPASFPDGKLHGKLAGKSSAGLPKTAAPGPSFASSNPGVRTGKSRQAIPPGSPHRAGPAKRSLPGSSCRAGPTRRPSRRRTRSRPRGPPRSPRRAGRPSRRRRRPRRRCPRRRQSA